MRLEEVLPAHRAGKDVRRKKWNGRDRLLGGKPGCPGETLFIEDVLADDWEVVEPKHKACPFCGGEAKVLRSDDGWSSVGCIGCGVSTNVQLTTEEAWAAWDRRSP